VSKPSGSKGRYLAYGALALVAAGGLAWLLEGGRYYLNGMKNGPAHIETVRLTRAADGTSALLLTEFLEFSDEGDTSRDWRVTSVRLRDGEITGRAIFGHPRLSCEPGAGGRVWCTTSEGDLELRDATTLALVADKPKLLATSPDLAGGLATGQPVVVIAETGEVEVVDQQGHRVRIDAATLLARRGDGATTNLAAKKSSSTTASTAKLDGATLRFAGAPRAHLEPARPREAGAPAPIDFLMPVFLADPFATTDAAIQVGDAVLIAHATTLDPKQARKTVSAMRTDASLLWSHEDAPGSVLATHVEDDVAMVVVGKPGDYVMGLDVKTGALRYRYDGTRRD